VSNLSNEVPFPKEPINDENPTPSRVMLFTLLLLIAGLLMTGTMMLYYSNAHRGDREQTTAATAEPAQTDNPLSSFIEKMDSKTRAPDSDSAKTNTGRGVMGQLFGGRNNFSANWPKLKLTGFGSATDGSGGFAIINNHQYRRGHRTNGKSKLIEIEKHDVLMEYEVETNTISMNISD